VACLDACDGEDPKGASQVCVGDEGQEIERVGAGYGNEDQCAATQRRLGLHHDLRDSRGD